jgi:hypothetical protein
LAFSCPLLAALRIMTIPTINLPWRVYALLYNVISSYEWSGVYDTTSVDAVVSTLSTIVQDAMEQSIPHGFITN